LSPLTSSRIVILSEAKDLLFLSEAKDLLFLRALCGRSLSPLRFKIFFAAFAAFAPGACPELVEGRLKLFSAPGTRVL
jgi:hypothetical protein